MTRPLATVCAAGSTGSAAGPGRLRFRAQARPRCCRVRAWWLEAIRARSCRGWCDQVAHGGDAGYRNDNRQPGKHESFVPLWAHVISRSAARIRASRRDPQWVEYALFLLSSAVLFMTIWPDLVSTAQPPVVAATTIGAPVKVT